MGIFLYNTPTLWSLTIGQYHHRCHHHHHQATMPSDHCLDQHHHHHPHVAPRGNLILLDPIDTQPSGRHTSILSPNPNPRAMHCVYYWRNTRRKYKIQTQRINTHAKPRYPPRFTIGHTAVQYGNTKYNAKYNTDIKCQYNMQNTEAMQLCSAVQ